MLLDSFKAAKCIIATNGSKIILKFSKVFLKKLKMDHAKKICMSMKVYMALILFLCNVIDLFIRILLLIKMGDWNNVYNLNQTTATPLRTPSLHTNWRTKHIT